MQGDRTRKPQNIRPILYGPPTASGPRFLPNVGALDTMEHQAPAFYRAHGFTLAGQIPDWDSNGHSKCYLFKPLGGNAEQGGTAHPVALPASP